ncbi:exodeoxyribonuclease V subunit alpha [Pseudomonas aeruginosa]|uniref:exodeoxyribonuclease V subunit alpha n=1 Tax=Pseudomonas aeruginosa TaxID=287 RepID=UPI0010537ADD|nr:exodeoxyribonuclease V subunit alpha [Pseudomonas aeruginosa]
MNPTLKQLAGEVRDGRDDQVAQPLAARHDLLRQLDLWVARGWLRALDRAFVAFLVELQPQADPRVLLAAALTSHQLGHGHVCLDLEATLGAPDAALSLPPEGDEGRDVLLPSQLLRGVRLDAWREALAASSLVEVVDERPGDPEPSETATSPLVLCAQRLYLRRYWRHELEIALALRERLGRQAPLAADLAPRLAALFAQAPTEDGQRVTDWQKLACALAARGYFSLITGGPGTGKTTTVVRLLGLLQAPAVVAGQPLRIRLAAPSLLDALPPQARLILLGDKDQLASVEAGAVLGDLCRDAEEGWYSAETRAWLQRVSGETWQGLREGSAQAHPLAQQTVMLRHSRRFGASSGIGRLARLVNRQQADDARALLDSPPADLFDLRLRGERDAAFARLFVDGHPQAPGTPYGYRHYLQRLAEGRPAAGLALEDGAWERWAQSVLTAFDAFRLLCALRRGPWGVEGLNQRVAAELLRLGLIEADHGWYEGRPVLVTRNDYSLGLMNGDIGIALRLPERNDDGSLRFALRVAFPRNDGSGGVRFVLPSRLVEVDTVFAMTVHKSQGSEFAHTALVLPDALNPVLTKELVYTGITRARDWFSLVESLPGVFEEAVRRKVRRLSGLMLHLRPEREEQPPHAPGEQTELPF